MKSRSHRSLTNNEWVVEEEESWTVDCICGVNFDDGEEMVNCDECGVWVHTRCSRYVKSKKLFACDKCKSKNNRNDSEETEVAQLLVELPTKTLRMDYPSSYNASTLPPPRRPFRLWAETPLEERVHVQGVPGGDPALFSGSSSSFGPQLWKSTGFVPKKFNFRYREFPSWDEEELAKEELEKKNSKDTHNKADNGADVLLTMSKENILSVPAKDAIGVKSQGEDAKVDRLETLEQTRNSEDENLQVSRPCDVVKDQSLLQSSVLQSGKRKKEDLGMFKDKTGKKNARILEKDGDFKKKSLHTPGPDRGPKSVKADPQSRKNANFSNILPVGQSSQGAGRVDHVIDDHKCHLASSNTCLEKSSCDAARDDSAGAIISKEDNGGHALPAKLDDSPKTIGAMASPSDKADSGSVPINGEVVCDAAVSSHGLGDVSSTGVRANSSELFVEDAVAAMDNHNTSGSAINMAGSNLALNAKAKEELGGNRVLAAPPLPRYDSKLDTAGILVQYQENSADCSSAIDKGDRAAIVSSVASNKAEDVGRSIRLVNVGKERADEESADYHQESMGDSGGSEEILARNKDLTGFSSKSVNEQSKCTGILTSQSGDIGECEVALSTGKSPLADDLVTKSPPAYHMNITVESQSLDSKQKETSESNITSEVIKDEQNHERPKKLVKEPAKSSLNSASKSSESKKVLHSSVSKRTLSDSKENILHSTPKSQPFPIASAAPRSEPSTMLHEGASNTQKNACMSENENASTVQKTVAVLPQKGEKINQSVSQSSSKVNTSLAHAAILSSSSATLSDEELALLLHQELNSSPRVPRVPRMRHAGSLPQMAPPTATTMKKTSSSGGKEPILTFRRKAKDAAKDGSQGAREVDDETKKRERVPSSSDHGRQDSASTSDLVSKREADGSTKVVQSVKKSNASISGTTATSGLSSPTEANQHNLSPTHKSRRNPPDDGKGVVGRRTHLTLPGLIAEIMSKGERMTYEELCNSVLPHWPNLRKHNGERYAYSSHSQAVLDCLRNRNEWARLVDRGPKTSGGRKRRKLDADASGIDSDDDDDNSERTSKDVRSKSIESHHEEFPKGKRKARKRRRLALQGRGIRDVRRRRRIEEFSDDEVTSFSSSSEETTPSEDERPVVRRSRARN